MTDSSFYKISDSHLMDPFLMTITSGDDHWMYVSSTGCLTAGRNKAEFALFPYVTDDILHRNSSFTGPITIVRLKRKNQQLIWEPFAKNFSLYNISRNIYKNSIGNKIIFEEINKDLGLTFSYQWQSNSEQGFIRKSFITNQNKKQIDVNILDGLMNILPAGVELRTTQEMNNLANAYKVSEYLPENKCSLYYLNSLIMDRPQPGESLRTNIVSYYSKNNPQISVCEKEINNFRENGKFQKKYHVTGKPGCMLTKSTLRLKPEEQSEWYLFADVNKTQSQITHIIDWLKNSQNLILDVEKGIINNNDKLVSALASADAFQQTRSKINDLHHTANVLFNVLRGGVFNKNYKIKISDFLKNLKIRNKKTYKNFKKKLPPINSTINLNELIHFSDETKDPSIMRLSREYLPLTLSRRHGDPSRPWNRFEIKTTDENNSDLFYYEGNWRDIFQNWEALGLSFPIAIESMIAKFVNATSVDGYNPYRINSDGIDWEVSDPDDPWSYIGYWNDHQIIYLQKLLEHLNNYDHKILVQIFSQEIYSYANIPYRLRKFSKIISNPKETIDFDYKKNKEILESVDSYGTDIKLIQNDRGNVYHVNLCEKLLVLTLAKISNLIPDGGIWLNTQRPEWNDANNALVGYGASMVTVYYLRRFLNFFQNILNQTDSESIAISQDVKEWLFEITDTLVKIKKKQNLGKLNNKDRMKFVTMLGESFSSYRSKVYDKIFSEKDTLKTKKIHEFLELGKNILDYTIDANEKKSLFNAYNIIDFNKSKTEAQINDLGIMLEGQVSALGSGRLSLEKTIKTINAIYNSKLYRKDQKSFILYPKKEIISFLNKNIIPSSLITKCPVLKQLVKSGDTRIIHKDIKNKVRFNPDLINAYVLKNSLNQLRATDSKYKKISDTEYERILDIYERVFNHKYYTGRSGTMFSYEGIGSIYWHMVSKLLLSVQENFYYFHKHSSNKQKLTTLGNLYYKIRDGLSSSKTPKEYGAFPFDPYSHSPSHSGAQQPGMTGQVKEEILTRFGEFGCLIRKGEVVFSPILLRKSEFLVKSKFFKYYNIFNSKSEIKIKKNQLAFTFNQVPIIYDISHPVGNEIRIKYLSGETKLISGSNINIEISKEIFNRRGTIASIKYLFNKKLLKF